MKEIKLTTTIKVYANTSELSPADQVLLQRAHDAVHDSYSPYSNFKVGAAVRLANDEILGGSNQENASYPLCLCAERTALSAAASIFPKEEVTAIAVTAKSPTKPITFPISPCGACRQVLCETENKHKHNMRVILQGETGEIYEFMTAKDLMPLSFDSEFL